MTKIYDFKVKNIEGHEVNLNEYRGKLLLIVNVASKCGFTSQYKGLEELYREFKGSGLEVLGFPCNQFGAQEPGDEAEIKSFCTTNYDITFPMFAKIDVNGDKAEPLYEFLKENAKGILGSKAIKWNFTKFLVGMDGNVIDRYAPNTSPKELVDEIKKHIN